MQIKNILSHLSDPTRLGQNRDALESAARKTIESSATGIASGTTAAGKLRDILAGYDVTNISPKMFSELLQKLQQSGVVSDKDLQELSQVRTDLERDGIGTDQRVNLLDMYSKKLQSAEQDADKLEKKLGATAAQNFTGSLRRRVEWMAKFAAVHASPEGTAINALA